MLEFRLGNGFRFSVNESKDLLGSGMEACVYTLRNGQCVKIYAGKLDAMHRAKLKHLQGKQLAGIILPLAEVFDQYGDFRGELYEQVAGENLHDLLNLRALDSLEPKELLSLMLAIARPVAFCHRKGTTWYAMGDMVKPPNIVVTSPSEVYFVDSMSINAFGFRITGPLEDAVNYLQTPGFTAPEILLAKDRLMHARESDVWALCCVLYSVWFGHHPFEPGAGPEAATWDVDEAVKQLWAFRWTRVPKGTRPTIRLTPHPKLDEMLRRGLIGRPVDRPTAEEIVQTLEAVIAEQPKGWFRLPSIPAFPSIAVNRKAVAAAAMIVMTLGGGLIAARQDWSSPAAPLPSLPPVVEAKSELKPKPAPLPLPPETGTAAWRIFGKKANQP